MATCDQEMSFDALELPEAFDELEGLLHADLQAIVSMVVQRAHERLFLTRREFAQLQQQLWNDLVDVINRSVEPLSVENR